MLVRPRTPTANAEADSDPDGALWTGIECTKSLFYRVNMNIWMHKDKQVVARISAKDEYAEADVHKLIARLIEAGWDIISRRKYYKIREEIRAREDKT